MKIKKKFSELSRAKHKNKKKRKRRMNRMKLKVNLLELNFINFHGTTNYWMGHSSYLIGYVSNPGTSDPCMLLIFQGSEPGFFGPFSTVGKTFTPNFCTKNRSWSTTATTTATRDFTEPLIVRR